MNSIQRRIITSPISSIPVNPKSHVRGWTETWAHQLDATIDPKALNFGEHDVLYLDHGVNFGGTLNLFGGANKELFDRINRIAEQGHVISLDHDMPDYGAMIKKRIGAASTYEGITEKWCDEISDRFKDTPSLKQEDLHYDTLSLGDSHTIAFSAGDSRVFRNDGKTLFSASKGGFSKLARGIDNRYNRLDHIILCFGSIDIRHHLLRHDSLDLGKFISDYIAAGIEFADRCAATKVSFSYPVPVEYEGRKLPKTGFFKGTPFFGTWQQRFDLTNKFIDLLETRSAGMTIAPPASWYTMDPEKYAKTYMELGSSVHIAPPFYYRNNWGQTCLQ